MKQELTDVKAIVFDTFGTVVDWRGSIIRDLSAWGATQGLEGAWARLADLWRRRYQPQIERVRSGELPWTNLDDLHYETLCDLLPTLGLSGLDDTQRDHINRVWHRLDGWPDAGPGLRRLKGRFVIGPLSNGNIALLINIARHAGLPWDAIFSAEHFQRYKPHPETYLGVCRQLCLEPTEVMMCAAHNNDLRAARMVGLKTAFIVRPTEHGPDQTSDLEPEGDWDLLATDLEDLAAKINA